MSKVTISRLFDDYADAQKAVINLREAGVAEDDISIIANNADKWYAPDYAAGAAGGVIGMLAEAGVAVNDAEVYAESIRRGGSLVSAKVEAADKDRLEALLHPSSVDIAKRRSDLASSGWSKFDPSAPDLTAEEIKRERGLRGTTSA
jgi:long-subunit acyl-CoA synthetase (AMP-forming)